MSRFFAQPFPTTKKTHLRHSAPTKASMLLKAKMANKERMMSAVLKQRCPSDMCKMKSCMMINSFVDLNFTIHGLTSSFNALTLPGALIEAHTRSYTILVDRS
eukprot:gb/GECG01006337.1/.p1 GENE.gb/GECG01006337.1/~~gb/GECG01006337.1/.p1  ORF type:complete len:103 (+),score=6.82 gb/GECG01006337.1/:1-309(+)